MSASSDRTSQRPPGSQSSKPREARQHHWLSNGLQPRVGTRGRWVAAAIASAVMALCQTTPAAADVTVGGPFALTAPDGSRVTNQTYKGKWLLVYFGYTSCPNSCPTALADIAAALQALGPDASKLQPLFITVDPQRDTPRVVGDYVRSFDPRIVGLSGTSHDIDLVMRAYGAYAEPHDVGAAPQGGSIDHSVYIYLMDFDGGFIRAFDPGWSGRQIAAAIRKAMAESAGPSAQSYHAESQTLGSAASMRGVER